MKLFCIVLISGVLSAQVASLTVTEKSAPQSKRTSTAGIPIVGYTQGPGPLDIRSIVVTSKLPKVGDAISVPENSKHLYLPPRQQYALVEQASEVPLAVWAMHKSATTGVIQEAAPLPGAIAHPDLVSFSPRGDAALLFSQVPARLQVVTHLPAEPKLIEYPALPSDPAPISMAVSDDGLVVVAVLPDGRIISSSNSSDWSTLHIGLTPASAIFIASSHDLAMSDTTQQIVAVLSNVGSQQTSYRILAHDISASQIAVTKDGEHLMAANLNAGQLWSIDTQTGSATAVAAPANLDKLTPLRDGFSFLVSNSDTVSVLKLNPSIHTAEGKR